MKRLRSRGGKRSESLRFKVSAGLKRLIGRDFITDDEVAIFELVKNSFDAGAKWARLYFDPERIVIVDNGCGMDRDDIKDKWMRVAYSSKRDESEDYRDQISKRRLLAGSKGIGRFSSDRLGQNLRIQSRPRGRNPNVHVVNVNWEHFEVDEKKDFNTIRVKYTVANKFDLPMGMKPLTKGTVLEITGLREEWDRAKLLKLKASLAKLINPFGIGSDSFKLEIIAPYEKEADQVVHEEYENWADDEKEEYEFPVHHIANGPVENFIFDTLAGKTTHIRVRISDNGKFIESILTDRGEEIYHIREQNNYEKLKDSGFQCTIFYLNTSAKYTFTRRMGIPSVQFGSVFLFRNGIRVYPFGEQGDDTLAIDRRAQQGVRRFLSTRNIIGQINVSGSEEDFKEATSRNQGLVRTEAYDQLVECFWDKCLKRLERYVVGVSWPDAGDRYATDLSHMLNDPARARVTEVIGSLAKAKDVEVLSYSKNLVKILDEKADEFEGSLRGVRAIALKTNDSTLLKKVEKAEKRFKELQESEMEARAIADAERKAREGIEEELEQTQEELEEEKKRSLFLASLSTQDLETVQNLHHQIVIYATGISLTITKHLEAIRRGKKLGNDDVISLLSELSFKNQQVLSASRFATRANFRLEADYIKADLPEFIMQYVEKVTPLFIKDIRILTSSDGEAFIKKFRPIEASMIIDNLVSNAQKARATKISFNISVSKKERALFVEVDDDGYGLDRSIKEPERIFEKGFTKTKGSGLGLYHVRQILGDMGGSISVDSKGDDGMRFLIRVIK